jgi:hypothetical protein
MAAFLSEVTRARKPYLVRASALLRPEASRNLHRALCSPWRATSAGAMLERYSHTRMAAKRDAMAGLTLHPKGENSEALPVKVPVVTQAARVH